jgi:hypothetical protein
MGIDFIRKTKGSIRKCRDKHKAKLSTQLVANVKDVITILVKPKNGFCFSDGQLYELHLAEGCLGVYFKRQLIGISETDDSLLIQTIEEYGGKALGKFHAIRQHSGRIDVSVHLKGD